MLCHCGAAAGCNNCGRCADVDSVVSIAASAYYVHGWSATTHANVIASSSHRLRKSCYSCSVCFDALYEGQECRYLDRICLAIRNGSTNLGCLRLIQRLSPCKLL